MAWDLNTVANVSTALAVLAALVFGILQIRQMERKRRDTVAVEAVRTVQSEHIGSAVQTVLSMPDELSEKVVAKAGPEAIRALATVESAFDTLGWLVYRRVVGLHEIEDLWGGEIRAIWTKVKALALARRETTGSNRHFEWTQWMVERMDQYPSVGKRAGAFVSHRDWKP